MKNPRLHFVVSALVGLFAAAAPLRAANVLYFRDAPIGPDRVAEALAALGHNVTLPNNADSFQALLELGTFDLGIIFVQTRPAAEYASAVQALSAFVEGGGRALYADWSRNAALAAGLGAGFTGSGDEHGALVLNLQPAGTVVPQPIKLRNTGWFHATSGLMALPGSTVAAIFPSDSAAIVRGPSGRSLVFGFLGDTPETADIFARGAEAVLAPAANPVVFFADDPAALSVRSAELRGFVIPTNATTTFAVDYGLTASYDTQTAPQRLAGGYSPVSFEVTLEDLAPHTTYHYRFRASNLAGTTPSEDLTFTTLNTPPVAVDDRVVAPGAGAIPLNPLDNDSDGDGDSLAIMATGPPEFGSVTIESGTLIYTPAAGGLRADAFTYTLSDGFGGSSTATVFIDVPLPHFRGDYTQLLVGSDGNVVGRLALTLNAGGAFTGRLLLGGRSDSVTGAFGSNGHAHFVAERSGTNRVVFDLDLLLTDPGPRILGGISDGTETWPLNSSGVFYDGGSVPPFGKGGRYTLATVDSRDPQIPRGEAWAVFAGQAKGRLRLTGRFADGELFFADTQVQPDGTLPLYVLRKKPPVETLAGVIDFVRGRGGFLYGDLAWTRFPTKNKAGFSVISPVNGGRYRAPRDDELILRFPADVPPLARWARARLNSGLPGFPQSQMFRVATGRLFPSAESDGITLQFSRRTGQFTGSFDHPTRGPCHISGVLLQQWNLVRGNFSGDGFSGGFRLVSLYDLRF